MSTEFSDAIKDQAYARDRGICQLCRQSVTRSAAVFHHVIPQEQNGQGTLRNCATLHKTCHDDLHGNPNELERFKQNWYATH